jgi:hypothetical protein
MPILSSVRSNSKLGKDILSITLANSELCESAVGFNTNNQFNTTVSFNVICRVRRPQTLYYSFYGDASYPTHFNNGSNTGTITKFLGSRSISHGTLIINQTSAYSGSDTSTLGLTLRTGSVAGPIVAISTVEATVNNFRAVVAMQNNSGGNYTTDPVTYGPGETEVSSGITIQRQVRWRVRMPPFSKYSIFMNGQFISWAIVAGSADASDFTVPGGTSNGIQFDDSIGAYYVFGGTSINDDGLTESDETFQVAFQYPPFSGNSLGISTTCTIQANST